MEYFIEGTPISIVKHADITIEVACDIYPIHIRHKDALFDYFKNDSFFMYGWIEFVLYGSRITSIKYKFGNTWVDVDSYIYEVEGKINDVVDCYMSDNGGYHQIKA